MDETYQEAKARAAAERRKSWAARIHAVAHKDIVEGCGECALDAAYLDGMTLEEINARLDASIADSKR